MWQTSPIDWPLAIERNRAALLRVVVTLFGMLGLAEDVAVGRIGRGLSNAIRRVLRPAEAAVRRLIVAAARDIVVKPRASRSFPKGTKIPKGTGKSNRPPAFKLSDAHEPWLPPPSKRRPPPKGPRITVLGGYEPPVAAFWARQAALAKAEAKQKRKQERQADDGKVDGANLARRLLAIKLALEDIPRQARRLARWKARRELQAD